MVTRKRTIAEPVKQEPTQLDRIEARLDALTMHQQPTQCPVPLLSMQGINYILHYLANGHKIDAIREYRAIFGVGLKEAIDAIEGKQ